MAPDTSAEKTARAILSIFAKFNTKPEQTLPLGLFIAQWVNLGNSPDDFVPGIEYAAKNGWIVIQSKGSRYKLTTRGYQYLNASNFESTKPGLQDSKYKNETSGTAFESHNQNFSGQDEFDDLFTVSSPTVKRNL